VFSHAHTRTHNMSEKAAQAKGKQQQQKGKGKQPTADHQHTDKPTAGGKAKQPQGGDRALSNSGSNGQQSRQPKAASPSVTRPEASSSSLAPSSSSSPQGAAAAAVGGGAAPTAAGNKGAAKAPRAEKEKGSGIVKAVLSGDKIEVYVDEPAKRTAWVPPPIKELKLSNVKAPLPYAKGDWGVREEEVRHISHLPSLLPSRSTDTIDKISPFIGGGDKFNN